MVEFQNESANEVFLIEILNFICLTFDIRAPGVSILSQIGQNGGVKKYDAQRSIFDEIRGVSSGAETLCRILAITSQTKYF